MWARHRLAQRLERLACVLQVFARLVQAVFQQALHIVYVIAIQRAAGVVAHGTFQAFEQVLVVDDVAVFLVVTVQPIHPANGLEQAVVAHLLVYVQIGGRGRIKAGEQLVHHDQQLHLAGLVDELLLHLQLKALGLVDGLISRLVEPVAQHLAIDGVLQELVGQPFAGGLALGVGNAGAVAGDDGAFALQLGPGKQLVKLAGLVNAARHQHGVAVSIHQTGARCHVHQNVIDYFFQPVLAGQHALHGAPLLL